MGFDGSLGARRALALAGELARGAGGHVRLMAVGEPADRVLASASAGQPWGSVAEQRLRSSAAMGSKAVRAVEAIGIEASGEAVPGFASDRLQRLSGQVDLLVVGSSSHGAVRRALLGSMAEGLLQTAHCPVLVVPCDAVRSEPGRPVSTPPDGRGAVRHHAREPS